MIIGVAGACGGTPPLISITSQPQDVTKYKLQAFSLTVETESVDSLENLTYQWMAGSTEVSTAKTLNATPYYEGYASPIAGPGSSPEGDTWCVNGASVFCVVSDSLGNEAQSRTVQITISGSIKPVVTSGYVSDVYVEYSGSSYNDLGLFGLTATCANAPSGRRAIYVVDDEGSESAYELSAYPLGRYRNPESAGSDKTIPFTFVNAFGETSAGDFIIHFGVPPSSRSINSISGTPGANWYPSNAYGFDSAGYLLVNIGVSIYFQSTGGSTGTGAEGYTWFAKSPATNDQYVPIAAALNATSLPSNSEDALGPNSYNYFIILQDASPVTIKLVNTNNWGSSSSEVTFQAS